MAEINVMVPCKIVVEDADHRLCGAKCNGNCCAGACNDSLCWVFEQWRERADSAGWIRIDECLAAERNEQCLRNVENALATCQVNAPLAGTAGAT